MMNTIDMYWLAGYIEAEGSFYTKIIGPKSCQTRLTIKSTDYDVLQKVFRIIKAGRITGPHSVEESNLGDTSDFKDYYVYRYDRKTIIEVLKLLYPFMSERRQNKLDECFKNYETCYGGHIHGST